MSRVEKYTVTCGICGETTEQNRISSFFVSGTPDLDTRPPEMKRRLVYNSVQHCPSCNYCSSSLSEATEDVKKWIKSKAYLDIINKEDFPKVAVSLLAYSYLEQRSGSRVSAAWRAIHAAWICDDKVNKSHADFCREKAIELIAAARECGQYLSLQIGMSEAIAIDLLRRTSRFDEALEIIADCDDLAVDEGVRVVIDFQKETIINKDTNAYTLAQASGEKEEPNTSTFYTEDPEEERWKNKLRLMYQIWLAALVIIPFAFGYFILSSQFTAEGGTVGVGRLFGFAIPILLGTAFIGFLAGLIRVNIRFIMWTWTVSLGLTMAVLALSALKIAQ